MLNAIDKKLGILTSSLHEPNTAVDKLLEIMEEQSQPPTKSYFQQRLLGGPGLDSQGYDEE